MTTIEILWKGDQGQVIRQPCPNSLLDKPEHRVIPGLDQTLCRCPDCLKLAPGGVKWMDGEATWKQLNKSGWHY